MLNITLIAVGKLREDYLRAACAEYEKRIGSLFRLHMVEVEEGKLPPDPNDKQVAACLEAEGARILGKIPKRAYTAALCIEGKTMCSQALSDLLGDVAQTHSDVALVIGSSHGLSEAVKRTADLRLSMSPMTFPHGLARVLLLEQVYRAGMIAAGRRYHK